MIVRHIRYLYLSKKYLTDQDTIMICYRSSTILGGVYVSIYVSMFKHKATP